MKKVLMGVALAAAVAVPSATAGTPAQKPVKLALVPLPASAIGAVAKALPLELDSGAVTNNAASRSAAEAVKPKQLAKLGRRGGYMLDYGSPFRTSSGVHEVETGVEHYTSPKGAMGALVDWRKHAAVVEKLRYLFVPVSVHGLASPKIADGGWAYVSTARIGDLHPIYSEFGMVRDGAYVLSFRVSAGSEAVARRFASVVAARLDARLEALLGGHLAATPVKLSSPPKAGPPPTGYPDPATAALAVTDFSQGTLTSAGYKRPADPISGPSGGETDALSEYDVALAPAGVFDNVQQQVIVMPSTDEAGYEDAILANLFDFFGSGGLLTPVDVSSLGDAGHAYLLADPGTTTGTPPVYEGLVILQNGPIVDLVVGIAQAPLATTDVSSLAQVAATKLDAAVSAAG